MYRTTALITLCLAFLLSRPASSQIVVPDEPSCATCKLEIEVLTTLGAVEGPGSLPGLPEMIAVDGRGNYWLTFSGSLPLVFDSTGRFLREMGRRGRGPGEFEYPAVVAALPGDSVLIIDPGTIRATVVAPDFRAVRGISIPPGQIYGIAPLQWPDDLVLNSIVKTKEHFGWPMHRATTTGGRLAVVKSFGANGGELRPGQEIELQQKFTAPRHGRIWAADLVRYRVTQWTADGERLLMLERNPPWFKGVSAGGIGGRNNPPAPRINAIGEDDAGRLWVFALVANPSWREAWASSPTAGGEYSISRVAWEHLYRTIIEVIDSDTRRMVARGSFDALILAALPGNRAAAYTVDQDGIPQVEILSIRVER